jgi:FtsZ-interacting cell division protein ZipA
MEINWIIVGIVFLAALILLVMLIWKNQRDKKKYTDFLNKDFPKAAEEDVDTEDDTY